MRTGQRLSTVAVVAGGSLLALACAGPAPGPSHPRPSHAAATPAPTTPADSTPTDSTPADSTPRELVYVANAGSGPVTAYPAGSHGAVAPVRTVANPNNPGTVWDPWGVTFDTSGHLYVQTFLSDATTFVFRRGASGTAAPSRIFQADGPDNASIVVDANGFEYVAGGQANVQIAVEPPGAQGKPGSLYATSPLRTIPLDASFNPWPGTVSVNSQNEVLAAVTRPQGNAIEVFAGGASGSARPVRVISGSHTGLGSCASACDQLSIAFSPLTGRIYAAVSAGAMTRISVFAGNAAGNAHPVRTIEGPATGLPGRVITGIADSQLDGTIYAMVKASQFGTGRVNAYGRTDNGNIPALWSFTDSQSGFAHAAGIAITGS